MSDVFCNILKSEFTHLNYLHNFNRFPVVLKRDLKKISRLYLRIHKVNAVLFALFLFYEYVGPDFAGYWFDSSIFFNPLN